MLKDRLHQIPLSAPVNVTWEITRHCNMNCKHCLSREQMKQCQDEMTLEQCLHFIDQLIAAGVFQINVGGGEPLLRPDIWQILDYCQERMMVTCVSTNGSLVDEKTAARLAKMPYLYMQVSLDGVSKETNDSIRGEGTYEMAMQAIENLRDQDFQGLSINTVVTAKNFRELPALYQLAKEYQCKPRLSRFRPSGGGAEMWQEYCLDKEQTLELADLLSKYKDIVTGDSFFSITREDRKHLGLNMCGACKMTCSVAPNGNMYPCAFLQQQEFLVGNVLETDFKTLWQEAPVMKLFRGLNPASCQECQRFDVCHGGCPAIAWFIKGDITAADPACICNLG